MLNRITIMGRLTADPELTHTQTGKTRATGSIAVSISRTPEITEFHDIEAWGDCALYLTNNYHKGSAIIVEGAIRAREYTNANGERRKAHYISASTIHFPLAQPTTAPEKWTPIEEPALKDLFDEE